jgi:hypothetical protein
MGSGGHLDELNPAQREAAAFGVPKGGPAVPTPPLLVVAGAGTGKAGTLAHRVAHLVLSGADPPGPAADLQPHHLLWPRLCPRLFSHMVDTVDRADARKKLALSSSEEGR